MNENLSTLNHDRINQNITALMKISDSQFFPLTRQENEKSILCIIKICPLNVKTKIHVIGEHNSLFITYFTSDDNFNFCPFDLLRNINVDN